MFVPFVVLILAPSPPVDASRIVLSAPRSIVEISTTTLKGSPFRLTWSPDAQQLYLQTVERDSLYNIRAAYHYLVPLSGQPPAKIEQEPAWSTKYWLWKSAQEAPGRATMKIGVEQQQKRVTGTAVPMGGDLAKGGSEGSPGGAVGAGANAEAMAASMQAQVVNYYTLKLKGEVIGEFVNQPAIPGLTFSWGPSGSGLIVFSNRTGHLVIMDSEGRKREVAGSKSARLPAWSEDGRKLAYLARSGKSTFVLNIVDVRQPAR